MAMETYNMVMESYTMVAAIKRIIRIGIKNVRIEIEKWQS